MSVAPLPQNSVQSEMVPSSQAHPSRDDNVRFLVEYLERNVVAHADAAAFIASIAFNFKTL